MMYWETHENGFAQQHKPGIITVSPHYMELYKNILFLAG